MPTQVQKKYLLSLSKTELNKKVSIYPYNLEIKKIADSIIAKIKKELPKVEVKFMGASALGISGQNDIDIYTLSSPKLKNEYINKLSKYFGTYVNEWKWIENGYEVTVYISNPEDPRMQEQIRLFNILNTNPELLKKYENIKKSMNGKSYKEYQIAKYEFYNEILNLNGNNGDKK